DYSKAIAWYLLAANQNHSHSQNYIGIFYARGLGVSKDDHVALEYYLKGAGNGHSGSQSNVGFRFFYGKGVQVDKYKALEWFIMS
ncbi:HCP-like protein, partial [Backusella circina FSU 941]